MSTPAHPSTAERPTAPRDAAYPPRGQHRHADHADHHGQPVAHAVDSLVTEVLEILLEQHELGAPVPAATIASRLPVDAGLVDAAISRLLEEGTATVVGDASEERVALSAAGLPAAFTAVRRHRLTERLLSDVIGLEWWKVHHEAERWHGVVSGDVEAKLIELLGDPGTCPHGNPIPGSGNAPEDADAVLLADAPVGPVQVLRITETLEGDDEALQLLQSCGFLPGKHAEIQRHERGWIQVAGAYHDAAIPPHVAAHTYVAPR